MAAGHYTYFDNLIPQISEEAIGHQKYLTAAILAGVMLLICARLAARLKRPEHASTALIPDARITPFGFVDLLIESFIKYHDSVLGKENRHHVPFVASIFFFIFSANLLGLVPGVPASTTVVWVNVAIALVVFCYFNFYGIKEHGLVAYVRHFMGPTGLPLAIFLMVAPLIFVVEIFGTCLRVVTLNLRLYWNITADHKVLDTFTHLIPSLPVLGAPFYGLGLFVSLMQAFIFATLTMIYILLATQHEEEH